MEKQAVSKGKNCLFQAQKQAENPKICVGGQKFYQKIKFKIGFDLHFCKIFVLFYPNG